MVSISSLPSLPSLVLTDVSLTDPSVVVDPHLQKEAAQEAAHQRVVFDFSDVIDEKHIKYMDRYDTDEEFWGIGIENETYLALSEPEQKFSSLKLKPERYSVNYTTNFKPAPLETALTALRGIETLRYPVYVNAHTFLKTDTAGNHRTFYDANGTANPAFTESIHDVFMRECSEYRDQYDTSQVFDGDTIEFITQRFYRATAAETVRELMDLKHRWLAAVKPRLSAILKCSIGWPEYNHGLVTFLTTRRAHLGICNSGTLHVNLTLPTQLRGGMIADKDSFAKTHLTFIQHIQLLEPLFAACYGTPDVFSLVDPAYSLGSLRLSRSRYVSLQSFDPQRPINGKLLLGPKPDDADFWYNRLVDSPYFLNATIGYDVNFNKFKNHGVEIRFFDWFPEQYLTDVIHVFILLAAHSITRPNYVFSRASYADIVARCVRGGFSTRFTAAEATAFATDLGLEAIHSTTPLGVLQRLADALYDLHKDSDIVQKMAPHMARPVLVDYNREAHRLLVQDVFGKRKIVIRAEEETRVPLVPSDVRTLLGAGYRVLVESSPTRCFTDAAYRAEGAIIVPQGYWESTRESVIVGLKALRATSRPHPSHTLLHFAHCFKGQKGAVDTLRQLAPCRFIDYEYLCDRTGRRILSFCGSSGKIGAYLALMAYLLRDHELGLPRFSEERYRTMLQTLTPPSILLIGYGTAGKAAKAVLDGLGLACEVWTSASVRERTEEVVRAMVRGVDVVIHAVRLADGSTAAPLRYLLPEDLETGPRVVCDISCDLGNPRNTLPIYTHYTSEGSPIQHIGRAAVIAIPNLPSLEAVVSSRAFSERLVHILPAVWGEGDAAMHDAIERSSQVFEEQLEALGVGAFALP